LSERLPAPTAAAVAAAVPLPEDLAILDTDEFLVRVHAVGGPYPAAWNELRRFGPTKSRFDHHTYPRRVQDRGIAYVAHGAGAFTTALAEYFQDDSGAGVGPIDRHHNEPAVSVFRLDRPVQLLDLSSGWMTRAKGNQAIRTGARGRAREWARAIYTQHGGVVTGLAFGSSVWGPGRCAALWESSEDAFPAAPLATRLLSDPALAVPLAKTAEDLGTFIV
jgi:hypothetical protein